MFAARQKGIAFAVRSRWFVSWRASKGKPPAGGVGNHFRSAELCFRVACRHLGARVLGANTWRWAAHLLGSWYACGEYRGALQAGAPLIPLKLSALMLAW
ncbi:unnamed protein product, partial [Iphiclides podalirius]